MIAHLRDRAMLMGVLLEAGLMLNVACGGSGRCGKFKVKVADAPDGDADACADPKLISPEDLAAGYRLACRMPVNRDLHLTIPEASHVRPVHLSKADVFELLDRRITPLGGESGRPLTITVDLGTTTIGVYCWG